MLFPRLLLGPLIVFFLANFVFASVLPDDELRALREIAKTLGKTNWDFSIDPCSGESGWVTPTEGLLENSVTCSSDTIPPHIVSIVLKAQNLQGTLPPELVRLPYLQQIDLTRNYLSGTIPPEWGSMQLVNISLLGNRLTGPIPKEIGNISTLTDLVVEINQLSGALPPELGNLTSIKRLLLTSNNFTGALPATFARLTSLKDFRIGDNRFTGKIPSFIQNWTNLEKLVIQASGLLGPIPSSISALVNLTDLRISDLNGSDPEFFPPLSKMLNMRTLILRSCNIVGELPDYLGQMTSLKTLDLSFNKLSGEIPSSYSGLEEIDFIDLSYNNFTAGSPGATGCQQQSVNLFASSLEGNNSYSLYINCGGREVIVGGTKYEDDGDAAGPSRFVERSSNWAISNTGNFLDGGKNPDDFIATNKSELFVKDSELYMNARLSVISLTYYGFCMEDGNYTVNLHFVEIMFTDDKTYSSLGRRIFDIYIQGKLVQEDFNIAAEAGGVGKAIIKPFPTVVINGTLEIRLYWAGKGTTAIPDKGVYGPLISAISVNPNFTPLLEGGTSLSIRLVVGIVVGAASVIFPVVVILWWKCYRRQKNTLEQDLKGMDLQIGSFTLRQLKAATNNFDPINKIGEGGFGPVYKGRLIDGKVIAVKQLSAKSKQGNREFVNEVGMISALQHPHLVKLYGCCIEGNQLLLIYEYMENNSLARALFGPEECQMKLDWPTRQKICIGIARGLTYLHEESRLKIVHRDIKATNVLLDRDLNPKISDFGLAKLDEEDNTHISTRVAGTFGYIAPEYAMRGYLTDKADVYSFGIVALEVISGMSNTSSWTKEDSFYLPDWALLLKEKGSLLEFVDPRLGSDYNKTEVMKMINVALLCTNPAPTARPAMSSVVSMLEGKVAVMGLGSDSSMSIELMRRFYQNLEERNIHENQSHSLSIESSPFISSSLSTADLYPPSLNSSYWHKERLEKKNSTDHLDFGHKSIS
ncbi:hypothetical protein SLEP1_g52401 [Rubroshorea leprosula]|uniref:non-specific serine/threonine protein kinase n=1 Tax=Rubroshorea leprosula TaxID=152421 RepID=A0AAV5M8T6_9ROSI|nr:hypothetical protein SLEP1_g52401 [Rubroshorea leprosula]